MTDNKRPLILISNDDGYDYDGIQALIGIARQLGDVVVVAPQQHQSGMGSAITIARPLRAYKTVDEPGYQVWLVDGTPTDCVKMALDQLLPNRRPDLLLSGINHGLNTGVNTVYSGTMGAVFEGAAHHVTSVGFSYGRYETHVDFTPTLPWVKQIIEAVLKHGLPADVCLNVNMPAGEIHGIKVTTAGMGCWRDEYDHRVDPFGRDYYWMTGRYEMDRPDDPTTDLYNLDRGWIAVTPCRVDQTAHDQLAAIGDLLLNK